MPNPTCEKSKQTADKKSKNVYIMSNDNTCIHPIPSKAAMAILACGGNGAFLDLIAKAVMTPKVVVPSILNIENIMRNTNFLKQVDSFISELYLWSN